MWLASLKQLSAVYGKAGKSATSVGLRAPAGRFDAARGESLDTSDGRRAVSSSPGGGPWTAGGSSGVLDDAKEGIEVEMLPLVLSLAPCGGAGCCPRPPFPWRFVFLSRAIDETDSPSYSRVGPHAALGPTMTLHLTWPPSVLLPLFFWFLDIDSQLLGLGGRTPAAAAATGASAAFPMSTSHYAPSYNTSAAGHIWPHLPPWCQFLLFCCFSPS